MSESKNNFGGVVLLLLAGVFGVAATIIALAAAAAWMVSNGCSGTMAQPLAAAAVGAGSLCGGFAAALCRKERRLLRGAVLGCLLAVFWGGLAAVSGAIEESGLFLRCGVAVLCSSVGGALAANLRRRRG